MPSLRKNNRVTDSFPPLGAIILLIDRCHPCANPSDEFFGGSRCLRVQVVFSEKKAKNTEKKQTMYSWGDSGAGDLRLQAVPADPGLTEVSCGAIAAAEAPYEAAPPFPTAAQAGETTGALPACAGLLSSRWALCHLQSLLRDLLEFELDGEASLLPSLLLAVVPHSDAAAASQGATRPPLPSGVTSLRVTGPQQPGLGLALADGEALSLQHRSGCFLESTRG